MSSSSGAEEIEISNTSSTSETRRRRRRNNSLSLHNTGSSSSSSSKKSFSSSSTSSRTSSTAPSTTKAMEEVWKDLNLTSLSETTNTVTVVPPPPPPPQLNNINNNHTNYRNMIYQDFLARPFCTDRPPTTMVPPPAPSPDSTLFGSPLPQPLTALSLNSGPEFPFLDGSLTDPSLHPNNHISNVSSFTSPFETLDSSSCLLNTFGKKRFQTENGSASGNRRNKRMIKNRESAARSRARKQAYTNELELVVAQLSEENERLRRRQNQINEEAAAAAADKLPKKRSLQRTLTAPF
ncbi:protein FD isoform X1 [Cannabis sativa]|uniref:protein FD isoform X1 n=2 Tax=Cannabis sativa TaxID=3483 RepID=UPI0029CA2F40|nr:protein FD isoform X1 [Cannabis sativa]